LEYILLQFVRIQLKQMDNDKYRLLKRGIALDLIGMISILLPLVGPIFDFLWAPYAARQMQKMYKGNKGKVASVFVFLEEILPFTDVIPSFTLMWCYTFLWKKQVEAKPLPIRVGN